MSVIKAIRDYVTKLVRTAHGMKVLLLDNETTGIVSMVFPQSEILQEEVYLFERLDTPNREIMAHLKAVAFLRPTEKNKELLRKELRKPKYGQYFLFFTNVLPPKYLEDLAAADEHEVVEEVQEVYGDYFAVNHDTFTLNMGPCMSSKSANWQTNMARIVDGLSACCLSLKLKPYIRFTNSSAISKQIAQEFKHRMESQRSLFNFRSQVGTPPVMLLFDRKEDLVTPLLLNWTYQAMVHEYLTIDNNRVDMRGRPGVRKELEQIVLSPTQDSFYKSSLYNNFGDLGISIKQLVDEYAEKTKINQNIKSLDDMKKFIESYPEFKKLSGNVSKHMAIMEVLQTQVADRKLLDISELEQTLACSHEHAKASKAIFELLDNPAIEPKDALRVVMLYALRFETHASSNLSQFISLLQSKKGLSDVAVRPVRHLIQYGGAKKRSEDLFENKNWIKIARGQIKRGLYGVTNIYTQHTPLIKRVVQDLIKTRLRESLYPFALGSPTKDKPTDIILFVVGGITYEEAAAVHDLNVENPNVNIFIGSTTIFNTESFIEHLEATSKRE